MSLSDPIADMLTCIRNASAAGLDEVEISHSKMKSEMARVMKREGYILDYGIGGQAVKKTLRIFLRYTGDHKPVISGLRRISKPGIRRYTQACEIPRVLGGMGLAILSTSSGIMSDKEARKLRVGGEVLCYLW